MFTSATVQGATGFGFVIVAAPVLTSFLAPTLAVPVLVIEGFVLTLILFSRVYRSANSFRLSAVSLFQNSLLIGMPDTGHGDVDTYPGTPCRSALATI